MMVVLTEQREIGQVRGTSVGFPPSDVVRVHEEGVGTTGEATVTVASHQFPTLRIGRIAVLPPFVHGVADVVIERQDHGGVTRHPADGLRTDEAFPLEFTREVRRLVEQGGQGHVATTVKEVVG